MAGIRAFVVGAVLAGVVALAPGGPAQAEPATAGAREPMPAITVTPRVDLVDDQGITISGRGLPRDAFVYVVQCRVGRPAEVRCDGSTFDYTFSDRAGAFSMAFHVSAVLGTANGPFDCRPAAWRCDLRVFVEGPDSFWSVRKGITFVPGSPIAPTPDLSADPHMDLIDGQTIEVKGHNYHPNANYYIFHCLAGAYTAEGCDPVAFDVKAGPDGSLSATISAGAIVHLPGADVDCRRNECELVAERELGFEFVRAGRAPIAFSPDAELQPDPSLSVTPSTGLTGRQTVTVSGANFRPYSDVLLLQCKANAVEPFDCDLTPYFMGRLDQFFAPVGADGTFAHEIVVKRRIPLIERGVRDCGMRPCEIGAFPPVGDPLHHPISFRPL